MTQFVLRLFVVIGIAVVLYGVVCLGVYIRRQVERWEHEDDFREWSRELQ